MELPENWTLEDDFTGKPIKYLFNNKRIITVVIEEASRFGFPYRARYGRTLLARGKDRVWHAFVTEEEAVATMLAWLRFKTAEELRD